MKPTKKSDDNSLANPNEILRKKKQILAISDIQATVAPLAHHDGTVEREQIASFIFGF